MACGGGIIPVGMGAVSTGLSTVCVWLIFFFFSSRRRHTRFDCDWSSDVCSSDLFGVALDTSFRLYWVIVPVTLLMLLGAANLFRTRIGRAFIAIRDRDISAEVLGIPLLRYKLLSFGLSSFYAGVAGGLWAYFFRVVTPESFPLLMSIFFLAAIIVGGMGSILGGILGAVFMTMVPELLKLIVDLLPGGSELAVFLSPVRTMVFGLLIIVFLVFEPQGLAQMWRRLRRFFHLWPFRN